MPILVGAPVPDNCAPMDAVTTCFAGELTRPGARPLIIAVGDVRDDTGKYSVTEGTAINQGCALMVASALGKLGGSISLAEGFDPSVRELAISTGGSWATARLIPSRGHRAMPAWHGCPIMAAPLLPRNIILSAGSPSSTITFARAASKRRQTLNVCSKQELTFHPALLNGRKVRWVQRVVFIL